MRSDKDLKKYYMCTFNTEKNKNQGSNLDRADIDSNTGEPFCLYGGCYWNESEAGAFAFGDNDGNAWKDNGYRVVLVCECTSTQIKNQGLNLNRADEDSGGTDGPFCIRGGNYENGSQAGAFAFGDNNGGAWNNYGYRVVLVCEQHFDASKNKNQGLNLNRADEDSGSEGFCIRGGNYWNGSEAGAFAFADNDGNANNNYGYRVVLVCEQHFDASKDENQGLNLKRADEDSGVTEGVFCIRGGAFWNSTAAGAFAFADDDGNEWNNKRLPSRVSLRVALRRK